VGLPAEGALGGAWLGSKPGLTPLLRALMGLGGAGAGATASHGKDWAWILKLLGGEIAAKKMGLL